MWKRIIYGEWADVVPYIAFFLTFGVFLVLAIRTLMMRKKHAARLAHLPLEEQPGDYEEKFLADVEGAADDSNQTEPSQDNE